MDLWRISNHHSLGGEGGLRASARWHTRGQPIVYLAESPSGALLEVLVHLRGRPGKAPDTFTLLKIEAAEYLPIEEPARELPEGWQDNQAVTRMIGDEWLAAMRTPMARVPSVILNHTFNVLLNPLHPQANELQIKDVIVSQFDRRLFGLAGE